MNTNKIEIYWNLIPNEYNQDKDANSFGFRVKCGEYDTVFTGIELARGQINDWDAFRYIAYICDFYRDCTSKHVSTKNMNSFNFAPNYQTDEVREKLKEFQSSQSVKERLEKARIDFENNECDKVNGK